MIEIIKTKDKLSMRTILVEHDMELYFSSTKKNISKWMNWMDYPLEWILGSPFKLSISSFYGHLLAPKDFQFWKYSHSVIFQN